MSPILNGRVPMAYMPSDDDTTRFVDLGDTDLSDYLEITVDETNDRVGFAAKIGDFWFYDVDDSDFTDVLKLTNDDASGAMEQETTKITDGSIWKIDHGGTFGAGADLVEFDIDLDDVIINDAATTAVTLYGMDVKFDAITATAVGLSTIVGQRIVNPINGEYSSERGILITCDKTAPVANNAITIETSRDVSGTLIAAEAITNYSVIHGQAFTHSGGDFVGTSTTATAGVMQINMDHSLTVNTTADDVFASTALDINVTSTQNSATAQMQCGARALDINYLITNTAGTSYTLNDDIDIARIVLDSAGTDWIAGASCDWDILEINGNGFIMNDSSFTLRGLHVALASLTDTDFEAFYGISIEMPATYQGTDPTSAIHATGNDMTIDILHEGDFGIELETDVTDLSNALLPVYITKDMNVTVAAAGGATLTNSGNTVDVTIDTYSLDTTPAVNPHNTSAVGLRVYQRHRQGNANDVGNIDEGFSGATLDLDQVLTINNTNVGTPTIATTAPFIDMDLTVTATAGAITIGAVDWVSLAVTGGTITSAATARGFYFDSDITLNHANAIHHGLDLDLSNVTLTSFSAFYGEQVSIPTLTGTSSGIHVIENTNDRIVDIIDLNHSILLSGDIFETSNWLEIKPSAATYNLAYTVNFLAIDTDNLILDDDTTALVIRGGWINLDNHTETEIAATTLHGLYIEMPDNMAGYVQAYGIYVENATHSVRILNDGVNALNWVGDASGDTMDLTPTTNVDVIDIDLTNNTWTSATAIDIDIGDWIGGSNIIDIGATEAGVVATNAAIFYINAGTNITVNDGGAGTQSFYAHDIDMSGITANAANFLNLRGINIVMPAAGHAAWGANKTSAIHATGNGNIFDALLGDGIQLTMTEAASIATDLISDVTDLDNALTSIYITKDMNITVASAGGAGRTNSGNTMDITIDTYSNDTTPAVNPHASTAVGMHVYQRHRQGGGGDVGNIDEQFTGASLDLDQILTINNANVGTPTIATTAPFIDMDLDVTETLGGVTIGAVDWIALSVDGGSITSAATVRGFYFDSAITLNHANAQFRMIELNSTGMTDTVSQADSIGGFFINDDGILDYGIKLTNATDTLKFLDSENSRGIYIDMATAASFGIVIEGDTIGTIANDMQAITTSRDFAGVSTADIAMTNYSVTHGVINTNTPTTDFDFDFDTGAGVMNLIMQQTNASTFDKTNPDKFNATCLKLEIDAITSGNANAELDAAPRGIDLDFAITQTLGTLQLGTTDVLRVNFTDLIFSTAAAMTLTGINAIVANAETFNDGNITFKLINIDGSNITNTASALLVGQDITMGTSADAGLRVTMGATPAIGGIQVVCNAVTDTAFTTNGEIVAGNYPITDDMVLERLTTDSLTNLSVTEDYEATVGGTANRKGIVLKALATAGAASGDIYLQYKVPSDFKGWATEDSIAFDIAGYDAVGGPAVIGTIALAVYEETNGAAINADTAAKNVTGGNAADQWTTMNTLDADACDVVSAGTGVGEKLIIKISFAITNITDYMKISIPDVIYNRTA